jgi:ATP synthase protein I
MIHTERVFIRMLAWQTLATMLIALLAFFISGKYAAISGVLGGFSVIFAASFASLIFARNKNKQDAASILISLIVSEIVKLVFVFSILVLVFKNYKNLVPAALIIGLMAAALVSGMAISKITSKPQQ